MTPTPHIDQYIASYSRISEGLYGGRPTMYSLLQAHGKRFAPGVKPTQVKWGVKKLCFMNAFKLSQNTGLIYVEGLAMIPSIIPVHHAWCVDDDGSIVDNTWRTPGSEYLGIPFNPDYVCFAAYNSGVYGVMDNFCHQRFYQDGPETFLYQGEI